VNAKVEMDVEIEMRDGVKLSCDIFRPDDDQLHPALLYVYYTDRRTRDGLALMVHPLEAVERGYILVTADCRGTFRSAGVWQPFAGHASDGHDLVEWIARQSWCDGTVGAFGASGMGVTAVQTALAAPPHLKAVFLMMTGANYHNGWAYTNGVFELWSRSWATTWRRRTILLGAATRASCVAR
jgi:uncharacterized protein